MGTCGWEQSWATRQWGKWPAWRRYQLTTAPAPTGRASLCLMEAQDKFHVISADELTVPHRGPTGVTHFNSDYLGLEAPMWLMSHMERWPVCVPGAWPPAPPPALALLIPGKLHHETSWIWLCPLLNCSLPPRLLRFLTAHPSGQFQEKLGSHRTPASWPSPGTLLPNIMLLTLKRCYQLNEPRLPLNTTLRITERITVVWDKFRVAQQPGCWWELREVSC